MLTLAADTGTTVVSFLGAYALLVLVFLAVRPKDVLGRRRALGCIAGLVVFFGLFVAAFAAWAADAIL
jgi:Kef-type K+ transport system membrane component KefB